MAKIVICDSYYPQFLRSWDFNPAASYGSELKRLLEFSFGTGDFYSRNLRALGWETQDVVLNWRTPALTDPDVLFMQNLSAPLPTSYGILAGQLSCPWPGDDKVKRYDVLFSSFPHYIDRIKSLGVRAVYNPLAFDPIVFERLTEFWQQLDDTRANDYMPRTIRGLFEPPERIHDVVFIGGVGNPSHWKRGMETLEAVAREIPTFKWWGYGLETLNANSPLRKCYQGEAWGLDYYRILLQSKIVLNRHGEVAEGYANNMRMFEATGCGAMLLTERAPNLNDFFYGTEAARYGSPHEAIEAIRGFLGNDYARGVVAENGQRRTLAEHTYAQRMKVVSDTLMEMLHATANNEAETKSKA